MCTHVVFIRIHELLFHAILSVITTHVTLQIQIPDSNSSNSIYLIIYSGLVTYQAKITTVCQCSFSNDQVGNEYLIIYLFIYPVIHEPQQMMMWRTNMRRQEPLKGKFEEL